MRVKCTKSPFCDQWDEPGLMIRRPIYPRNMVVEIIFLLITTFTSLRFL